MSTRYRTKRRYPKGKKAPATRRIARQEVRKQMIKQVETKYLDSYATGAITAIDYTGTLYSAHADYSTGAPILISQGTGINQYLGQKINPRYLKIRWALESADTTNIVSMVVIQAKGQWTNTGTMANIYQSTGTTTAPLSAVNTAYNNRFRVLYRREVTLDSADDNNRCGVIKIGPKKLRPITFSNQLGLTEVGHIMIGFISDSGAISHPTARLYWRLYYKDA